MSWSSRFGNLGRFSPFSRSPPQGSTKVSDADFSYITTDDLKKHHAQLRDHEREESYDEDDASRNTDALIIRNKMKEFAIHFAAYSIAKGELTIGQVREHAAKRMDISDPKRIKLVYKGKTLRDDQRTCRSEGLKDGAEIFCPILESVASLSGSDDENEDMEFMANDDEQANADGRKRRNRGKKSKRRLKREQQQEFEQNDDSGTGVAPSARPAPPLRTIPAQASPMEKLNIIGETLHDFEIDCENFTSNPPAEPSKRDFEYKRLSESILAMVLLKLDGVETDGDADARARRKQLVRDAQAALSRLDDAHKL